MKKQKSGQHRNHTNGTSRNHHYHANISRSNDFGPKQRRNPKKFPKRSRQI